MSPQKLIEVSIPLEAINKESACEKSINHKPPSTLHLWWSHKPLATARAELPDPLPELLDTFAKLGSMYPQIMTREGSAKVIAWLWARKEFCAHRDGVRMIAVVAEKPGGKGRLYLSPDEAQVRAERDAERAGRRDAKEYAEAFRRTAETMIKAGFQIADEDGAEARA